MILLHFSYCTVAITIVSWAGVPKPFGCELIVMLVDPDFSGWKLTFTELFPPVMVAEFGTVPIVLSLLVNPNVAVTPPARGCGFTTLPCESSWAVDAVNGTSLPTEVAIWFPNAPDRITPEGVRPTVVVPLLYPGADAMIVPLPLELKP
jgi:hypothetical protein